MDLAESFRQRRFVNAAVLAALFDLPEIREEVARAIGPTSVGRDGSACLRCSAWTARSRPWPTLATCWESRCSRSPRRLRRSRVFGCTVRWSDAIVAPGAGSSPAMQVVASESPDGQQDRRGAHSEAAARRRAHACRSLRARHRRHPRWRRGRRADGAVREVVFGLPVSGPGSSGRIGSRGLPRPRRASRSTAPASRWTDRGGPSTARARSSWDNLRRPAASSPAPSRSRERSLDGLAVATGFSPDVPLPGFAGGTMTG